MKTIMSGLTNQNPTEDTYGTAQSAYEFFNITLFGSQLPDCLITLSRKKGSRGYFAHNRFTHATGNEQVDEIALNPETLYGRTSEEQFSTLVHEMCHLWQFHFGDPGRGRYHNKEWAEKMLAIGLTPSDTGLPGGKMTGQKVTHFITPDGAFAAQVRDLIEKHGHTLNWHDRGHAIAEDEKKKKNKVKYTCPECGVNAWAKPDVSLICGACHAAMA